MEQGSMTNSKTLINVVLVVVLPIINNKYNALLTDVIFVKVDVTDL